MYLIRTIFWIWKTEVAKHVTDTKVHFWYVILIERGYRFWKTSEQENVSVILPPCEEQLDTRCSQGSHRISQDVTGAARNRVKLTPQNPDRVFLSSPCQRSPKANLTDLRFTSLLLTGGKNTQAVWKGQWGRGWLRGLRSGRMRKVGKKISSLIIWMGF